MNKLEEMKSRLVVDKEDKPLPYPLYWYVLEITMEEDDGTEELLDRTDYCSSFDQIYYWFRNEVMSEGLHVRILSYAKAGDGTMCYLETIRWKWMNNGHIYGELK